MIAGLVALYLVGAGGVLEWQTAANADLVFRYVASFGSLLVGFVGLIGVLVARHGEPLDRRPMLAALTGVAQIWFGVVLLAFDATTSAAASALAGSAFLVGAIVDWMKLVALLESHALVEHQEPASVAPPIVADMASPVALFSPAPLAYRESAKGEPLVSVPIDRVAAKRRLASQVVVALIGAFVALPFGVLAAPRATPYPAGTIWRGQVDDGSTKYPFTLTIESARGGRFSGAMDWGSVVANVEGTYDGDSMSFYDRSIRRTNGAPFILNERKAVRVAGDRMMGTDKDGLATLDATRLR